MRYDDITTALDRANPDDWVRLPERVLNGTSELVLGLREDLAVTMVLTDGLQSGGDTRAFSEPWTPSDIGSGSLKDLELRDHVTVVVAKAVADLDGGRWYCPLPRSDGQGNWELPATDVRLGQLLNELWRGTDTLSWAGRLREVSAHVEANGGTFTVG